MQTCLSHRRQGGNWNLSRRKHSEGSIEVVIENSLLAVISKLKKKKNNNNNYPTSPIIRSSCFLCSMPFLLNYEASIRYGNIKFYLLAIINEDSTGSGWKNELEDYLVAEN